MPNGQRTWIQITTFSSRGSEFQLSRNSFRDFRLIYSTTQRYYTKFEQCFKFRLTRLKIYGADTAHLFRSELGWEIASNMEHMRSICAMVSSKVKWWFTMILFNFSVISLSCRGCMLLKGLPKSPAGIRTPPIKQTLRLSYINFPQDIPSSIF